MEVGLRDCLRHVGVAAAVWAMASTGAHGAWLGPHATAHLIASWKRDGLWRTGAVVDPPKSVDGHRVRYMGRLDDLRAVVRDLLR